MQGAPWLGTGKFGVLCLARSVGWGRRENVSALLVEGGLQPCSPGESPLVSSGVTIAGREGSDWRGRPRGGMPERVNGVQADSLINVKAHCEGPPKAQCSGETDGHRFRPDAFLMAAQMHVLTGGYVTVFQSKA